MSRYRMTPSFGQFYLIYIISPNKIHSLHIQPNGFTYYLPFSFINVLQINTDALESLMSWAV